LQFELPLPEPGANPPITSQKLQIQALTSPLPVFLPKMLLRLLALPSLSVDDFGHGRRVRDAGERLVVVIRGSQRQRLA
jgi:hypothetical protein